jgi:hypothetical protein
MHQSILSSVQITARVLFVPAQKQSVAKPMAALPPRLFTDSEKLNAQKTQATFWHWHSCLS